MFERLNTWLRARAWRRAEPAFEPLFEALDLCKCTGHRRYVRHLFNKFGVTPFEAAVECITNVGNFIQANNIRGDGRSQPVVDGVLPSPVPVAPVDLSDMTVEDEERVFYALLANRYDRRLSTLTQRLRQAGHGTHEQCKALADKAVTSWCPPLEEDLDADDLFALLSESGALNG